MFSGGRFSDSFTVKFPTNNADPGPRAGNFPTDPELVNGPVVDHALIDAQFPPGTLIRNVRHRAVRQSRSAEPLVAAVQPRLRASDRRQPGVQHGFHPLAAARAASADGSQSGPPGDTTLATSTLTRNNPLVGSVGEFAARVDTIVNDGSMDYNTVQVSMTKRPSAV